jgi:hypothetical protein
MKTTYFYAGVIAIFISAPAFAKSPELHDTDRSSYYSQLMNPHTGNYTKTLNNQCKSDLIQFFKAGKSLRIPAIYDQAITIKNYKIPSGKNDNIFYHNTNHVSLEGFARVGDIDHVFWFFRSGYRTLSSPMYVAEDPESSADFGDMQIKLELNPEGRVLTNIDKDLGKKVNEAFPQLMNCTGDIVWGWRTDDDAFVNLLLEENGIDLYDYYGDHQWFTLVRKSVIQKVSVGKHGEW